MASTQLQAQDFDEAALQVWLRRPNIKVLRHQHVRHERKVARAYTSWDAGHEMEQSTTCLPPEKTPTGKFRQDFSFI
jgi:hypothetical protein